MQDVPHHEHVRLGQRVGEEVAGGEAQALAEPEASDVGIEDRLDRGQVEPAAGDVLVRQGDLNRHGALGAADVDHAAVIPPGKLGRDRLRRAAADGAHRACELREPRRVGVERLEEVLAALRLVLRGSGPQALGQRSPEPVETGVRHLQDAHRRRRAWPGRGTARSPACWRSGRPRARACPARRARRRSPSRSAGAGPGARAAPRHRARPPPPAPRRPRARRRSAASSSPRTPIPSCMIASGVTSAASPAAAVCASLIDAPHSRRPICAVT